MKPLEPPDSLHLQAAQGWLELGNHVEADAELDNIALRRQADASITPIIAPSQGVHLVFDRSFLPGESAIMVPHTSDGRVMFAIPWHGHTLIGTTDTPVDGATLEPVAMEQ